HAGFVPREAFHEDYFGYCRDVFGARPVARIRGDDEVHVRQHGQDHHHDELDAGRPRQDGDGQAHGPGQCGHEQGQYARRLQALHDGPACRHDEVRSRGTWNFAALPSCGAAFSCPGIPACRKRRESGYSAARMSSSDKSHSLTRLEARRIWLRAQRLDTRAPFGAGPAATTAAVEHLGYVQIDTINVIERSHHHVLWTRIPDYRRSDLRHAQSIDKSVFEYWTHALSYVPTRDIRFFIPAMKQHAREGHRWFAAVTSADLRKVMRLIRRDGALTIRDIEDDVLTEKEHLWASRNPSKRALQLAFYSGALAISERNGMLKTYELMTRHFGWDKTPKAASARETTAYLLDRGLRAQGLVSLDSICHLDAPSKAAVKRL